MGLFHPIFAPPKGTIYPWYLLDLIQTTNYQFLFNYQVFPPPVSHPKRGHLSIAFTRLISNHYLTHSSINLSLISNHYSTNYQFLNNYLIFSPPVSPSKGGHLSIAFTRLISSHYLTHSSINLSLISNHYSTN